MDSVKVQTVEDYIRTYPAEVKKVLTNLREIIKKAAPNAEEVISYNMPAFRLEGMLVWYAGYKHHVGFYPKPSAIEAFKEHLSAYKLSKGTVQFTLDKPLPVRLIMQMVKYRIKENVEKAELKLVMAKK
jgi:uncharacterized protein YdhG (YjbR/CyaY superfamily)